MSGARAWVVREATPADDAALAALFRSVFRFERGSAHHGWKFRANPDGPPLIAVAEHAGRLVGQYALWPTRLRLGSSIVLGAQSLDTMTLPDYRGQGMFTMLAEHCMQMAASRGIEVLYGFPNENSYHGFVYKLDWDCIGRVPLWVRPLRPSMHRRTPRWAGPFVDLAVKLLPIGGQGAFRVEANAPESDALELLLGSWREELGRCRVERSGARFRWRFSADSGMQYRWVSAYDGGRLCAVAVWGVDLRSGNAVLAEALGSNEHATTAVVSAVVRQALRSNCPVMLAASNRSAVQPALRRSGFLRRGSLPLIVRKLTPRTLGANVHLYERWDIFGADLDTF